MSVQVTKISDSFSVCPQIEALDVAEIAVLGFKSIVNNRPDMEGGDTQPTSAQIQQAATATGLRYLYLPIVPNQMTAEQVAEFKQFFVDAPKPVFAFCRTGNRAGKLFEAANAA